VQSVERLKTLGEGQDAKVDDGADGRVVVQRDDRVHLGSAVQPRGTHLETVQQQLDHDESRRLERERGDLAEEAEQLKVDLSVCGWASAGTMSKDRVS